MRILIADDEGVSRSVLKELLTGAGFEVIGEAKDGAEALDMARKLDPDVAILDVVMPRMTGLEAAKEILALGKHIRVVILSSVGHGTVVAEALASGASAYLNKPPKEDEVVEVLKNLGGPVT